MNLKFFLLLMFFVLLSGSVGAGTYKREYKLSVAEKPKLPWSEGATFFADLVRDRTQGRVNIKVYADASLMAGKWGDEFLFLKLGAADFAFASALNWSLTLKELNLFNLPFLFPDYQGLDRVTEGYVGEKIKNDIRKKGVTILAWGENGYREISNNKRPIVKPEDLLELKVSVVNSPIFIDIMKCFGVVPINLNQRKAKEALRRGVVDGQDCPVIGILIPERVWEFCRYLTVWHYVVEPLMMAVNNHVWQSFSPVDREIIRQAAIEAAYWQKMMVRRGLMPPNLSVYHELTKNGMQVTRLTPAQIAVFKTMAQPVYDKWVPKIGQKLYYQTLEVIKYGNGVEKLVNSKKAMKNF